MKKLFVVRGEIEIEDVVMADSEKAAKEILEKKCKYDTSYVNEFVYGSFFNAKEVKKRMDVSIDLINQFPWIDKYDNGYEMTCDEIIKIWEEKWEKEENFRIRDRNQLKFDFYNQTEQTNQTITT